MVCGLLVSWEGMVAGIDRKLPMAVAQRCVIFGDLHGHMEKAKEVWDKMVSYMGTDADLDGLPVVFLG